MSIGTIGHPPTIRSKIGDTRRLTEGVWREVGADRGGEYFEEGTEVVVVATHPFLMVEETTTHKQFGAIEEMFMPKTPRLNQVAA